MSVSKEHTEELKLLLHEYDVKIRYKEDGYDVWWHSVAAFLAGALLAVFRVLTLGRFSLRFSDFITVFGRHVYLTKHLHPFDVYDVNTYRIMRHELLHIMQEEHYGRLRYFLMYLALPFPVVWTYRAKLEFEAYTQDMIVYYEVLGYVPMSAQKRIRGYFTSPAYLFMRPFKSRVRHQIHIRVREVQDETITGLWPYRPDALSDVEEKARENDRPG